MSRGEIRRGRAMRAVAVEHHDFQRRLRTVQHGGGDLPGARRRPRSPSGGVGGEGERFGDGVGGARCARASPRRAASSRQQGRAMIHRAALGVQIQPALGELGHLGDAAGHGDARDRMAAQVFQHAADEIAHVDQRDLGQPMQRLHRLFGGAAGGAGDMGKAGGARHIDAAMDAVDPGGAGIRARRCRWCRGWTGRRRCRGGRSACARRAPRRRGWRFPRSHRPGAPLAAATSATPADHLARHRVDRGLAGRHAAGRGG